MNKNMRSIAIFAMATTLPVSAFIPTFSHPRTAASNIKSTTTKFEVPYFAIEEVVESPIEKEITEAPAVAMSTQIQEEKKEPKALKMKKKQGKPTSKAGIFTPLVLLSKFILGQERLLKIRGKAISMHSQVIKDFVDTSSTPFGRAVMTRLFAIMDKDGNGTLDEQEMALAFEKLGFSWLEEKQVQKILKRADADGNGVLDFDEFAVETPKTLKTNLVKLAKKNGDELGFLS